MFRLNVLFYTTLLCSLIITLITRILYFFMDRLKMSFQITFTSILFVTLVIRILCLPWIDLTCVFKWSLLVSSLSQRPQGYLIPLCWDWICFLRWPFPVNCLSHWSQGYLIPSCLEWICFWRQPILIAW